MEKAWNTRVLRKTRDLYDAVSDALVEGNVIGWFSGRAEFGPRALGARSIIADPRREDAKELLNSKIKRRESFRPFAPSILSEHVNDWFELDEPVPFMEKVFPIKPARQAGDPRRYARRWLRAIAKCLPRRRTRATMP